MTFNTQQIVEKASLNSTWNYHYMSSLPHHPQNEINCRCDYCAGNICLWLAGEVAHSWMLLTRMGHTRVPSHAWCKVVLRWQRGHPHGVRGCATHTHHAIRRTLHRHEGWAIISHHALGEKGETTQKNPCICDMQMCVVMHYKIKDTF